MTVFGPDRPGHAPARVAPVLGEAVEDARPDRGRRPRRSARRSRPAARPGGRGPDVVRVELVEEQRAVELARDARPSAASSSPATSLPVGLHGFESSSADEAAAEDLAPQIVGGEGVAALALEQDRDRR